jgi:multidrug efflux pump subunit AcrA (membrane-fusion protein)
MGHKKTNIVESTRSEEVQEILSAPPSTLLGWGSSSMLIILLLLVFLGFFIKYPETIDGEAKLTTSIDPALIYNLSDGYIEKIHIEEDSSVREGHVLGEIRNVLSFQNISYFDEITVSIRNSIKNRVPSIKLHETELSFGLLQESYNKLLTQVYEYNQLNNAYHLQSINRLIDKIEALKSLSLVLKNKLSIGESELANAKIQYQIDEKLYKEAVIAKSEWIEKTSRYNQKLDDFQNLKQSFIQNDLQIKEMESQLAELTYKNVEAKEKNLKEIELSLTSIQNYKLEWRQKYTLIAPINGSIKFIKKISAGDFLKAGQPIAYIVPRNLDIKAKVKVPLKGFGKIRAGQKARVALDSYPYQEFGFIVGTVIKVSEAPSEDSFYEVIIELPDNLITSFKRELNYKPNSLGVAEIITQDHSILERLIFSTRSMFKSYKEQ